LSVAQFFLCEESAVREWISINLDAFERDILRDFCRASISLGEQFARFDKTGVVSFSVLETLLGEPLNKGLLWRLKDKAHHVFLRNGDSPAVGPLLDWTLGYIFHESLKLMEDAHQRQYYSPRDGRGISAEEPLAREIMAELDLIRGQTRESMRREVERLRKLIALSRRLFCLYFTGRTDHKPLARFLNDEPDVVRQAFAEDCEALLDAVYDGTIEHMYVQAARSLLESARPEAAAKALTEALVRNPQCREALELQEALYR
jgi:hypothetical protein